VNSAGASIAEESQRGGRSFNVAGGEKLEEQSIDDSVVKSSRSGAAFHCGQSRFDETTPRP